MDKKISFKELPEEIQSEYLNKCFSAEKLSITDINLDLEKRLITANVSVTTDFENSYNSGRDNSYHWSAITAYRAVSQLIIGYICSEVGKTKKEIGEVLQISSEIKTKKPISDKNNVPIGMEFSKYLKREKNILGEVNYKLADGNFEGYIRFAVNLD